LGFLTRRDRFVEDRDVAEIARLPVGARYLFAPVDEGVSLIFAKRCLGLSFQFEETRDLLAPIYGWFTGGFDTLDLKPAKTLPDELA
jgi:hypothetical protein